MSDTGTPAPKRPRHRTGPSNKWIGRGFILLWIVAVVAVYIVIVKLKIGGERALRLPEETPAETVSGPERPPAGGGEGP